MKTTLPRYVLYLDDDVQKKLCLENKERYQPYASKNVLCDIEKDAILTQQATSTSPVSNATSSHPQQNSQTIIATYDRQRKASSEASKEESNQPKIQEVTYRR